MTSEIKPRIVYKLERTDKPYDGTDIYIGSMSLPLKRRLQLHRHDSKRCNSKFYKKMRTVGLYKWKILPLLVCVCNQKEIRDFEKNWIALSNADLNTVSPLDVDNIWGNIGYEKVKKDYYEQHIQNKTYYCGVCDKAYGQKCDLKKHIRSLKHSNIYMFSVD